jgi:hypothetical protein
MMPSPIRRYAPILVPPRSHRAQTPLVTCRSAGEDPAVPGSSSSLPGWSVSALCLDTYDWWE